MLLMLGRKINIIKKMHRQSAGVVVKLNMCMLIATSCNRVLKEESQGKKGQKCQGVFLLLLEMGGKKEQCFVSVFFIPIFLKRF